MANGFTKLFSSITAGTIWCEPDSVRIVWITMLAMMGSDGVVSASIPGLAAIARVSIQDVETALAKFLSPDKYSRTKEDEGRRIREVEGGWLLLNAEKYRNLLNHEATKERKRKWWNENRGAASKSSKNLARQNLPNSTQEEVYTAFAPPSSASKSKTKKPRLEVPPSQEMDEIVSKCEKGFQNKPTIPPSPEMHAIISNFKNLACTDKPTTSQHPEPNLTLEQQWLSRKK